MAERKSKRESESFTETECDEVGFTLEPAKVEVGSGYSLSVKYSEENQPIVDVKTFGEVDFAKLRKDIERAFPNALIRQQNGTRSVTIVKTHKRKPRGKKK